MQKVNEKLLNIIDRLQLTIDLMKDVAPDLSNPISVEIMDMFIDGFTDILDWMKELEEEVND